MDKTSNYKLIKFIILSFLVGCMLVGITLYTVFYFQAPTKLHHYKAVIMIRLSEAFLKRPFKPPDFVDFAAFIDLQRLKEDVQGLATEIPRHQYKVGELFYIKTLLINRGSYPVTISHGSPLFDVNILDEAGKTVELLVYNDEGVLLEGYPQGIELAASLVTIKPGQIYNYCPISYWIIDEEYRKEVFWFRFNQAGRYQIQAIAYFSIYDMKSLSEKRLESRAIWAQPVWIEVIDEK